MDPAAALLLAEFAQPMVVSLAEADASLQQVIQLIAGELLDPRCGQPALLDRAGDILFIGMLRHLVAHPRTSRGLFNGLARPPHCRHAGGHAQPASAGVDTGERWLKPPACLAPPMPPGFVS